MTKSAATSFIETFLGKFPTLNAYIKETVATARTQKEIRTFFKRRRRLPDIDDADKEKRSERQALNSVIQGTAADVAKRAMLRCDSLITTKYLNKATLLLQIHDELVFQIDNTELDRIVPEIAKIMETVVQFDIPFPVKAYAQIDMKNSHCI